MLSVLSSANALRTKPFSSQETLVTLITFHRLLARAKISPHHKCTKTPHRTVCNCFSIRCDHKCFSEVSGTVNSVETATLSRLEMPGCCPFFCFLWTLGVEIFRALSRCSRTLARKSAGSSCVAAIPCGRWDTASGSSTAAGRSSRDRYGTQRNEAWTACQS